MRPYGVSEVNNYINKTLSTDILLSNISIEGEISNFIHHRSGHMYFNLKDEDSRIKCVMFKFDNRKLDIELSEGLKVVAKGNISVYERDGVYQLYVKDIEDSGLGKLYREFEKLKLRLEKEGLFDEKNKKTLPKLPRTIGVVTSATGAAIKDIITVINRRFPSTNIILYPSLVQGKDAPQDIIKGLKYLDKREDIDLIIFGRGGGSIDELFAFNDEKLARVIFHMETPCISAVGHEIDFTISDFVADLRAATPSAAAELAVPNIKVYLAESLNIFIKIRKSFDIRFFEFKRELELRKRDLKYLNPKQGLLNKRQELDNVYGRISNKIDAKLTIENEKLLNSKGKLSVLNPRLGLEKGYGILLDRSGNIIKSVESLKEKEEISIILKDGKIKSTVSSITREEF